MPAEIQKAMDYTFISLKNTYCFLDDNLIVSKRSEEEHKQYVLNCLKRLDDKNRRINLPKCHFSKLEIDCLGYHISQSGISPIESVAHNNFIWCSKFIIRCTYLMLYLIFKDVS